MRRGLRNTVVTAAILAMSLSAPTPGLAGDAEVVAVRVDPAGEDIFDFSVTVRHSDEGWDHYANVWQVLAPDGTVLGERVLLHPHETEQPFTRSLAGVKIPEGITMVTVRAGDSVHGFGGTEIIVELSEQ